jgi:hypothetical protein
MDHWRVAKTRGLLPIFFAFATLSLLITGASGSTSTVASASGALSAAHTTNHCGVVAQATVRINSSVFPCVVTAKVGTRVRLVFDPGWRWSYPLSSSAVIQIRAVSLSSNGVNGAVVVAMRVGTATVSVTGVIICKSNVACPALARLWSVRFRVTNTIATTHTVTATTSDGGRNFTLHPGDQFVLDLAGSSVYSWGSPASSNSTALRLDSFVMKLGNLSADFSALAVGTSRVTAVENPNCYPQCLPPSRLFQVNVTVER